jgi:outer membrane protein TolC
MLPGVAAGQEVPQRIDLPTALKLAGGRSVDVELARERLNEARAQEGSTRARYFPWVSPSFTFRRHDGTIQDVAGNILETGKYSYAPTVGLTAQLDLGDTIYQSRSAKENSAAANFGLSANVQDAVLRAAGAYFDLAAEQALIEVARESLRVAAEYDDELKQAVEIGIATEVEAIRARVQRQRSELLVEQAGERRRLASIRLATAVRLDPAIDLVAADASLSAVSLVPDAPLPELVKQAMDANPDLKQGRSLVDAAEAVKAGASQGPLIPTLAAQVYLGGLGGARSGVPDRFGGAQDYVATLYWRVGPGGLFDGNRKALADAKVQIANLGLEAKRQEVERQVAEAHARVSSLVQQIKIAEKAMALAEDGLKLSRERKDFAVGGVLETLQAEQELTRARTDYLRAVADHNKAEYALVRTLGRLAPESAGKP